MATFANVHRQPPDESPSHHRPPAHPELTEKPEKSMHLPGVPGIPGKDDLGSPKR
jgi:hypothetical protein